MEFIPNNPFDEIIENLYLGDYDASLDIPKLKEKGIQKVLTISDYKNGPKYEPGEFIHKRIDITDYGIENIIQYFGEC